MRCFYTLYALYMLHKLYRCCLDAVALLILSFFCVFARLATELQQISRTFAPENERLQTISAY